MPLVSHPPLHQKTSDSPVNTNTDDNQLYMVFTIKIWVWKNKIWKLQVIILKAFTQVMYIQTQCMSGIWAVCVYLLICEQCVLFWASEHNLKMFPDYHKKPLVHSKQWKHLQLMGVFEKVCFNLEETKLA